ncbi:hypothetical protein E4U59_004502 [Claviceps monticola]|nr:hypothetical protein E4U59_004502 [Claviceps monticola]
MVPTSRHMWNLIMSRPFPAEVMASIQIPRSYKEAITGKDARFWRGAMATEMIDLHAKWDLPGSGAAERSKLRQHGYLGSRPRLFGIFDLDNPGPAAIEHLVQQTEGVRIRGVTTVECDPCGKAKVRRQIRRTPRANDEGPGERLAIIFQSYDGDSITKEITAFNALLVLRMGQ